MNKHELLQDLAQSTGTESYYRTVLKGFFYTDGVQFLAEQMGAYWLIDLILSYQPEAKVKAMDFQVWTLTVKDKAGLIVLTDGNQNEVLRQVIRYTDFPLDNIDLWCEPSEEGRVLYLPSEH